MNARQAGILMPLASIETASGCGDFGPASYQFIDQLARCGLSIWQILPLNPLGYGNSPYQPFSSFALDEIYLSLDLLQDQGLLASYRPVGRQAGYDTIRAAKRRYLKKAFTRFVPDQKYKTFCRQGWLKDYALFRCLKTLNRQTSWDKWKRTDPGLIDEKKIEFEKFVQYQLFTQLNQLKQYAHVRQMLIMGDLPFYVGYDSADVWCHRRSFLLDEQGRPTAVAGVPPDYFSATGQRWGNPLYNWPVMQKNNWLFWRRRLGYAGRLYDVVRIDHFRAFDSYWQIPADCPTACVGQWQPGYGCQVLDAVLKQYPKLTIVAEDLGDVGEPIIRLRRHYGICGMLVFQFCFDFNHPKPASSYLSDAIFYTGTHDNDTLAGWYSQLSAGQQKTINEAVKPYRQTSINRGVISYVMASPARWAIIPLADLLNLDSRARINTPSTINDINWQWRCDVSAISPADWQWLSQAVAASGRSPDTNLTVEKKPVIR